jgi:hypothetical protein
MGQKHEPVELGEFGRQNDTGGPIGHLIPLGNRQWVNNNLP